MPRSGWLAVGVILGASAATMMGWSFVAGLAALGGAGLAASWARSGTIRPHPRVGPVRRRSSS